MLRIPRLRPAAVALVVLAALAPRAEAAAFVAPEELEAGDRCVGRTVFEGSTIDTFGLVILGVVHATSPGADVIIARAEGERLEATGILQGMSGSPVYRGGHLIGAVAGTWPFAEEPIAAITPIGEMLSALDALEAAPTRTGGAGRAVRGSGLFPQGEERSSRIHWVARAAGLVEDDEAGLRALALGAYAGREVAPLAVPLAVSSGDSRLVARLAAALGPSGFVPVAGPAEAEGSPPDRLEPGSSVGVQLVGGDVSMAAIGTVTLVDGDRVLAFGHPLFNSGSIEMPMVGGYVHALLPLQTASFKYASATEPIGAVLVDRRRAVAGRLGDSAQTVPLRVSVRSGGSSEPTRYSFDVVRSPALTPFFSGMALADAISEAGQGVGAATVTLRAVVSTAGESIEYETLFATEDPTFRPAAELGTLLDVIYDNAIEEIDPTAIAVDVTVEQGLSRTEISRVEADRAIYRPGETVRVRLTLREWQGSESSEVIDLALPGSLPDGDVRLVVGGASSFHEREAERLGEGLRPRSYTQLLDLIDRSRPGNTVVAQIVAPGPGVSLSGSEMRGIPRRAALVLATSATSGAVDPTEGVVLAERELVLDGEVVGDHEIVLHVRSDR
jgi:hypothetical protein